MGDDPVTSYARELARTRGANAGPLQLAACRRHLRDLRAARAQGWRWDPRAAAHAIAFFGFLQHYKGQWRGQPIRLEPWQQFIVGSLFGWLRTDGRRRFQQAYIEIPRKNGKSTLAAGLALYLAFFDHEPGAEVYCAATAKEQARIVFDTCRRFVQQSPYLRQRIQIAAHALTDERTASKLLAVSSDTQYLDGLNVHAAIIDELHAHRNGEVIDVIETGMAARLQPMAVKLTTAGIGEHSICWKHHEYGARLLGGHAEDPAFFAFITGAEKEDDWTDPQVWRKANPNFGISVDPAYLEKQCRKAQNMPAAENAFRQKHLNQWVQQAERWIQIALWDGCGGPLTPRAELQGRACYAGLDLSATRDLTAFVLVFEGEPIEVLPFFWIPEATLQERVNAERLPWDRWVADGLIRSTPGRTVDYDQVREDVIQLAQDYLIAEVAYDPWNATQLATQLDHEGLVMIETRQGFKNMNEPTRELGRLLQESALRHGGHQVLREMAGNVTIIRDAAGNMRPGKPSEGLRIDGIVCLIMALDRLLKHGAISAYVDHGLMVLDPGSAPPQGEP